MNTDNIKLSAVIPVHNEETQLAECLECLKFADEIVVLLDKCTDRSGDIAQKFTDRVIEGDWEIEGERRNAAIEACRGKWIFEIDADERVPEALADEIQETIRTTDKDIFDIPVENFIGGRLIRHGWMAAMGTTATPRLFRKGVKRWGTERVHPHLHVTGRQGPRLKNG